MTSGHTHAALREMLAAEALHPSAGADGDAIRAHVTGCESCAATLARYRDAAAQLAFLAPREPMQAARAQRVRERLLARAAR